MTAQGAMIHFRLDPRSGVPAYRQLVDQVDKRYAWACCDPATSCRLCVRS